MPSAALVIFDGGEAFLGQPADAAPTFGVLVVGLEGNATSVALRGQGRLLAIQDIDILVGGDPPKRNTAVQFDDVPRLASNDYTFTLLESGNETYTSEPLRLWEETGSSGPCVR